MSKLKDDKCVWNMGTPCDGEVKIRQMFKHQITAPVCAIHFRDHLNCMLLNNNKYDLEVVLNMTAEQRAAEVKILMEAGKITQEQYDDESNA